ncbi:MAG: YjbH domain-containing protein [Gammaproteobacteria bacterium]|uniref:YjbH domain-containing protein n=1 Tax=Rhodoferax sp. TaxID=50421 RepID=UPI0017BBB318|nr:YjbH domain-containing protein [Rhodoferax sp.]MBU3898001.1 YjbH domain-containing protein [Gammaproteobacteria bacterium]MBA3057839.1 phosphatase PAP2 family protein [Rhodoferax sp.]MBU3995950.1 YjbH domain-containing protein [Gammaproteobacteria bacterium]MBU4078990.1 YjbH domain-containing protein [Gammaproteobacteria bacterium]MBU4112492.1 YjbH domain-containing protein [Gammaproteobacteria bacterium]
MKFQPTRVAQATVLCMACLAVWPAAAQAPIAAVQPAAIVPGERLSDWLLRNTDATADTTALHWQVWAERAPQQRLRQGVVEAMQQSPGLALSPDARAHLSDWLLALPLTGRLSVAMADARWLQAHPAQDPVLQEGQRIVLPARPGTVTVVTEVGQPCSASHVPGALVQDYLRACSFGAVIGTDAPVDWAWIAQADGRTQRFGIAPWNLQPQDEPGAGAWIWAPSRAARVPDSVSDNLARFLATQLPGEPALSAGATQVVPVQRAPRAVPRGHQLRASDWGEIGVLQTPSARMAPAGAMRLHMGRVEPYTRGTIMLQPLDWLETGFRYTDIANRLYGPTIAGGQSLKDKSIDFKLRLREESAFWPQVALGVRDLGGTGLFSGEYLVASKRWGNWDASLGLGWGYLGARGNLKNPLSFLGDSFNSRTGNQSATGGTVNYKSMFHGPTALFGGLQWQSPVDALLLKLELDGNDYQHEPSGNNQPAKSPFNVGAVYRYSPNIDFSLGLERGNRLMLGFTLHGGLNQLYSPKLLDVALPPVQLKAAAQLPPSGWQGTAQAIELYTGWSVRSIAHQGGSTTVVAETDTALHLQERIERAIHVLHRDAPASSTRFVLQLQERGLSLSQIEVDRAEWVAQRTQAEPPALRLPAQQALPGRSGQTGALAQRGSDSNFWQGKPPGFSADWGPSYSQILGGPDGFLIYQLGLQAKLEHRFTDSTWLSSAFGLRLLDNFDKFKYDNTSDVNLPRVRTHQREYVTTSRLTMPLLQLTHASDLGGGHYASAYAGMLESMYGGVGAEWLYRPWQSRLAVGVDVNHVRQRDFRQNLDFRDYSVNTGHATLYWDTGWNDVQLNLSAGRYLAGDVGATLDVKRVFPNGVAMGAWATKTDVSKEQFGEGSFDKGIYVTIPFDVMLPKSTPGTANITWNPLTRDGGARLNRRFTLIDLTRQRDPRALNWRPARPSALESAANTSYVLTEPRLNAFETLGSTTTTLGRQIADIPASTWLWAGGAILASSLLDKPAERWAQKHQTGNMSQLGTASNALPMALALSAGLLYTGIGGEPAASTAETALKAAAYTWGANLATRYVVGRARPSQELGNASFDGFKSGAAQSGFASNHVAIAFALATPFAQQLDMPWLYAVAAASTFGRVQKREHWVSDTVAGALLGYAMGSLLSEQQRNPYAMRLSVTPNAVVANWSFK